MEKNLSAKYYTTPEYFESERKTMFTHSWQLLGPVSLLTDSGEYISEDIAGMKVLAIRGRDGCLRAFRNVCRHRGAVLVPKGQGRCHAIRCPYHNWLYDDAGLLKNAPWFGEDPNFHLADWPLEPISIEVWQGLVFVCIDPAESLSSQLAGVICELDDVPILDYQCVHTEKLVFDANWKIYTDNFVEGYHIPGIHPEFYDAIHFDQFETQAQDGYVKMTAPGKKDLFYKGRWYWMWANWTLSLFEGGMNTSRINPIDHQHTELIYHFYFDDVSDSAKGAIDEIIQQNLAVVRQDFQICLDIHQNYASDGYQPGPLSPKHEQGVGYFQRQYANALNGS
ncbi:MAG: Rieske 2Fe-2S domain-containing protein [Gammaproteobacteria bacterium]|nr:Rieske 2Fe-2S domain-containing protein [Gammaproteobacteria bacterium]